MVTTRARASASSSRSSFEDLPAVHHLVASYLNTNQLVRVSGLTSCLRDIYLGEVVDREEELILGTKAFDENPCPPQTDPAWPTWVMRHAASLTRLLARVPDLRNIKQILRNPLEREVLGYALWALPGPTRLEVISLERCEEEDEEDEEDEDDEVDEDEDGDEEEGEEKEEKEEGPVETVRTNPPSFFALAMDKGQLPSLVTLDTAGDDEWKFMSEEPNFSLVVSAIMLGRLSRLTDAMIKGLSIGYRHHTLDEGGSLANLLKLPIFGSLEHIWLNNLSTDLHYLEDDADGQSKALAAYLRQPGGLPHLESLIFDGNYVLPLVKPFAEHCAPNLKSLWVEKGWSEAFDHLRTIYEANAFANLTEFVLLEVSMDKEDVRNLMEGVVASTHKGAAFKVLRFDRLEERDVQDGHGCALALLHGVRRGAYPNEEDFVTCMVGGFFYLTNDTIADYIDAVGEGFPWSRTLKSFSARQTGSVTRLPELMALLGCAKIVEPEDF